MLAFLGGIQEIIGNRKVAQNMKFTQKREKGRSDIWVQKQKTTSATSLLRIIAAKMVPHRKSMNLYVFDYMFGSAQTGVQA